MALRPEAPFGINEQVQQKGGQGFAFCRFVMSSFRWLYSAPFFRFFPAMLAISLSIHFRQPQKENLAPLPSSGFGGLGETSLPSSAIFQTTLI